NVETRGKLSSIKHIDGHFDSACICDFVASVFIVFYFFFIDTATTEIYTLSLHDALPISGRTAASGTAPIASASRHCPSPASATRDRKSTRLNSSHVAISYAVFCL